MREWIVAGLREQYREYLAGAQEAMVRFMREVEAVQLDLNEAAEDTTGLGRLGNDLRSFSTINGPFELARHSLIRRLLDVQQTHRRLQAIVDAPAPDGGRRRKRQKSAAAAEAVVE